MADTERTKTRNLYRHQRASWKQGNILLPPLHIKLGLVKQFIKALDFEGEVFPEIRSMFPRLSQTKIKGGIFIGPQKKTLLKSKTLEEKINGTEKKAWQAF